MTGCKNTGLDRDRALIIGLGNPGKDYAAHRHNIGFQIVDTVAEVHRLSFTRHRHAQARVSEGRILGHPVLLVKPQTYMNHSGRSVHRLVKEHQIRSTKIFVVYDDLDLALGRLRLRPEGGSGGHKGMRSIIDLLGTQSFPRLRIGIDRPPGSMDPAAYVLQPFSREERPMVRQVMKVACEAIECWLEEGILSAMDRFNGFQPQEDGDDGKGAGS